MTSQRNRQQHADCCLDAKEGKKARKRSHGKASGEILSRTFGASQSPAPATPISKEFGIARVQRTHRIQGMQRAQSMGDRSGKWQGLLREIGALFHHLWSQVAIRSPGIEILYKYLIVFPGRGETSHIPLRSRTIKRVKLTAAFSSILYFFNRLTGVVALGAGEE